MLYISIIRKEVIVRKLTVAELVEAFNKSPRAPDVGYAYNNKSEYDGYRTMQPYDIALYTVEDRDNRCPMCDQYYNEYPKGYCEYCGSSDY